MSATESKSQARKITIVSFHCDPDGGRHYATCAEQLIADCQRLGRPHQICERPLGKDWISAVRAKPTFLLEMYHSLRAPFLWMDVDNRLLSAPAEIDQLDCDWASVRKNSPLGIWDAVHYVGTSRRTEAFLQEWKRRCDAETKVGSHTLIAGMLQSNAVPGFRFQYLPQSYIHGPVITIGIAQTPSKENYFGTAQSNSPVTPARNPPSPGPGVEYVKRILDPQLPTLVVFNSLRNSKYEFLDMIAATWRVNFICFKDRNSNWFQAEEPEILEILNRLGVDRKTLFCCGHSSGGATAMKLGCLLRANKVLAFAPQSSLELELNRDSGWEREIQSLNSTFDYVAFVREHTRDTRYKVVYCPRRAVDETHARRCGMIPAVELESFEVLNPEYEHRIPWELKQRGMTRDFFEKEFPVLKEHAYGRVTFSSSIAATPAEGPAPAENHRRATGTLKRAFWWPIENFGDTLTPIILDHFLKEPIAPAGKDDSGKILAAGSILQYLRKDDVVWGTGVIQRKAIRPPEGVKFLAVRGPLTRGMIEAEVPKIYGDPAILLPLIYHPRVEKTHKIGLVPHYVDKLQVKVDGEKLIDVRADWKKVIEEILACEMIVSSSLHGIIVAEAYGIPAIWAKYSDGLVGGELKFQDYFLGTGRQEQDLWQPIPPHESLHEQQTALVKALLDCPRSELEPKYEPYGEPEAKKPQPAAPLTGEQRTQFEQLLQRGREFVNRNQVPEAIRELERAAKLSPQDADLAVCRGTLYALTGDIETARNLYCRALTMAPKHAEAEQKLLELTVGSPIVKANPPGKRSADAFAHLQRGFELVKQRKFTEAQEARRSYQASVDYDRLPKADNRSEANPKICAIIVACKTGEALLQCLDSLSSPENPAHEIIVVDNGGNESIEAELRRRALLHVRCPVNVLPSEGRNIGVHFARAPIVVFVDDDAIAAKNYLSSVLEAFETFDIHALRGKVLPKSDHAHNGRARHYNLGDLPFPADIDTEGNSAFRTDTWRQFGGQDPLQFGGEGVEFSYRMAKELGDLCTLYWPFAIIQHDYAVTDAKLETKNSRHALMREYSIFKHPDLYTYHNRLVALAQSQEMKARGNALLSRRPVGVTSLPLSSPHAGPTKNEAAHDARDPFVSICIPTYNRAPFIEKALQSALAQTHSNFEIVVVDDGSTDNTAEIMSRIRDPRVRFLVKEHSGGPATRNRCIAEARGEFLLWLDSDDALLRDTLQLYIETLRRHPGVDVLYGNLEVADEHLNIQERWIYSDYHGWRETLLSDTIIENRIPNVCTLVRKSCYEKVGGYNLDFPRAHDYEFWTRLVPVATFKSVNTDVGIYRRHEDSLSKVRKAANTSYEANAVKAMLAKHEVKALFPFCYAAGSAIESGNARAWLIASLLMVRYGDLASAVEFAKRSVDCRNLGGNADVLDILLAVTGTGSPRRAKSHGKDEFSKLVETAKQQFAIGQAQRCAQACAQLAELRSEATETLLLVGLSLQRWGNPQQAKTGFRCLVHRHCEAAHLEAVTEAETVSMKEGVSPGNSASERLAQLLSPHFGGERIPVEAAEQVLAFVAAAAVATDVCEFLGSHRERQTPLFFAVLGLTADELKGCVGDDVAAQIKYVRTRLQPAAPVTGTRREGYSFCIITGGGRRAKLERQIASIRALQLPQFEILVGGNVADVPNEVRTVDLADAARAGRLGKMRNELAKLAKFDHLVMSDDDIVFDRDFGKGLQRFGEGYEAMAIRILNPDGSRFWDWACVGGTRGSVLLNYWDADANVYITGGICVLKTTVLERVRWDDSRGFYQSEDVDFSTRLKAAGIPIRFNPFCSVLHDDDRYSRVDRRIFRFDHLLTHVLEMHQAREPRKAGRFFAEAVRLGGAHPERITKLKDVAARIGERDYLAQSSAETAPADGEVAKKAAPSHKRVKLDWVGSFLDHGSLSHVNRELTRALEKSGNPVLHRVSNNPAAVHSAAIEWQAAAQKVATAAASDAAITVRHAWPPDWSRPKSGKLVVVQPWEFGALPEQWVRDLGAVDEAWVPSEYVRRVYLDSGVPASKVFVVPNGVDPEKFNPQATRMPLATAKKFKFLFVGGTIFRKGPDVLLKAYLENFTAADDVCLVIKDFGGQSVYAGQTFEARIRAAQALPNAPEILYLNDELPPEWLPGLYTACDCLVLPYRGEGYGLPVIEAMACGLPVMVTAGGATDDFVRDDFGFRIPSERRVFGTEISGMKLVKPGWLLEPDGAVLGDRMKWIATHPEEARRRGGLARQHAQQFCSWDVAARIALGRIEALASRRTEGRGVPAKRAPLVLPPCALAGHLAEAEDLLRQKKFRAAWEATLAALARRPFHPEAYLLLAEIAAAVGDGQDAKLCAEHARRIAPELKSAKKFLNRRLKGNNRPEWHKLPGSVTSNNQHPTTNIQESSNPPIQQSGNPAIQHRTSNVPAGPGSLSVCLIVRNEEKFIAQCLNSVRAIAQQIVVVDTGSSDRTVEIAKELGAEVHSFTWCDDFSAARNAALAHATGDWILALDADEELCSNDHEKLHRAMSDATAMAWRLPIIDVGRELDGCSYVPRLFRNAPGLFYLGRVHEQIFSSIEVRRSEWGLENKIGDAALIHHGYTAEVVRDRNKVERNLKLLERAVEELPGEPHLLMNLGLELSRSGRESESCERYREAFETLSTKPAAEVVPELRESLLTQYCSRLAAAKRYQEIIRVLTSPLANGTCNTPHAVGNSRHPIFRGFSLTASLHFSLGLAHLELKQFREAADQMRQCLAKRGERSLSPINRDILTAAPFHCLALSLARAGEIAEAEKAFAAGLKELDHVNSLRLDFAKFLADQKRPVDALHHLNEIVTHDARNIAAWRLGGQIALNQPEFLEFARDWTGEAARHMPADGHVMAQRAEALMLSEDAAGARNLWEKLWQNEREPQALAALILCEAVAGSITQRPEDTKDEIAASRAFIEWYRKLFAVRAQKTLTRLMEQMNALNGALPSAAKILGAAMAEANQETVGV
jgi:glycosyltransferase involved in cell wall biosynthesis/Tfp pilus assembly protein PilF